MAEILTLINESVVKKRIRNLTKGFGKDVPKGLSNLNRSGVWTVVQRGLLKVAEEQFAREGIGRKWKRLTPDYNRWKKENYSGSSTILTLTGRLRKAATGKSKEYFSKKTAKTFSYGIRGIPYAQIHAKGGTIRRHFVAPKRAKVLHWKQNGVDRFSKGHWVGPIKIPKRDYTVVPRNSLNLILQDVDRHLEKRIKKMMK